MDNPALHHHLLERMQQRGWLGVPGTKSARTETLAHGVHADFDRDDHLVGLEVLDARAVLGPNLNFEVALVPGA